MRQFRVHIVQIPRWKIILAAAAGLALLAALVIVAFGVFLFVLPARLVIGALAYLFGGARPMGPMGPMGPRSDSRIIDAEYHVVEDRRIERPRGH